MTRVFTVIMVLAAACNSALEAAERLHGDVLTRYFDRPGEDGGYSIRQTSDGGYLVAGTSAGAAGDRDWALWKLTADLELDGEFAGGGWLRMGGSGDDQAADAIEVLDETGRPDGYLVVGYADRADGDFTGQTLRGKIDTVLVRLSEDGRLDRDWATDGILFWGGEGDDEPIIHHHNYSEPGDRLLQVPDGFLVLTHTRSTGGDLAGISTVGLADGRDAVLLKLSREGHLASNWGDRGVFRLGTLPGNQDRQERANDFLFTVRQLRDGDLIAAGYTLGRAFRHGELLVPTRGSNDHQGLLLADGDPDLYKMDLMVIKLDPVGRLRASWGQGGIVFIGGTRQEKGYDVHEDEQGRLLLTGRSSSHDLDMQRAADALPGRDMLLFRLLPGGAPDSQFGHGGAVTLPGGVGQFQRAVTLPDGRIAALGFSRAKDGLFATTDRQDLHGQGIFALFDQHGTLESLFTLGAEGEDKPTGLLLDAQGRVLVTGFRLAEAFGEYGKFDPLISQRELWVSRFELPASGYSATSDRIPE